MLLDEDVSCPLLIRVNIFGPLRVFFCCRKNLRCIDPSTITGSIGEISRKIHSTIVVNRKSDQSGNRSVCRIRWPWKAPSAYVSVGSRFIISLRALTIYETYSRYTWLSFYLKLCIQKAGSVGNFDFWNYFYQFIYPNIDFSFLKSYFGSFGEFFSLK